MEKADEFLTEYHQQQKPSDHGASGVNRSVINKYKDDEQKVCNFLTLTSNIQCVLSLLSTLVTTATHAYPSRHNDRSGMDETCVWEYLELNILQLLRTIDPNTHYKCYFYFNKMN